MLACVLALVTADQGTVGAVGVEIKQSLGITNTELGSLTAVSSAAGALAVLPVGVLTDRVRRVRFLTGCIALWSLAMLVGGLADSLSWLLLSRVAVGALTAAAGPTVVSLVGDFFPAAERGRIYGFILSGEMLGAGFGLVVGSTLAHLLSWHAAFWFLALLGIAFVFVIARKLPEPKRGGQSRLPADTLTSRAELAGKSEDRSGVGRDHDDAARLAARRRGIGPDPALVLRRDPVRMSLWQATQYVLSIRTNVVLIIASVIGYFFFAGLRTFAVVFVRGQYGVSQAALTGLVFLIGAGALLGVLSGGRVADRFARRGHISARMVIPSVAYFTAAVFFVPGLLTTSVAIALPFLFIAATSLSAANPPLEAARLDVVHFRLWGRAESVRTFLRVGAEAVAPVTFGVLADVLGPGGTTSAQGLRYAFLIMLVPLAANAVVLLRGRHAYPRDVATAAASERLTGADRRRVQ
ncbi:MFS transporter [Nonomuraea sp. CA-141351]|uniref:MFS transporter n=1 Tax=Nonomuraea sp. CA-141351 TaxID=3239996 RepID=UPI003D90F90B